MDSRADAGLVGTIPEVEGTVRAASRHPPSVPQSWVRAGLLELSTTVLLGALSLSLLGLFLLQAIFVGGDDVICDIVNRGDL